MKLAILYLKQQELTRVPADEIDWELEDDPFAEGLIKVTSEGQTYWCDEIEYINNGEL